MTELRLVRLGRVALHTRVERWECDFNDHWNLRYYVRAIQLAAEALAAPVGGVSPGAAVASVRHLRFHAELRANNSVEVRSAVIADGPYAGALVHLVCSDGRLAATALDLAPRRSVDLPEAAMGDLAPALPHSVPAGSIFREVELGSQRADVQLGPIRPAECDHTGALLWEETMRRVATISHQQAAQLGFTPKYTRETGITRMTVEMRIERGESLPVGTPLTGAYKLVLASGKSFQCECRISTVDGAQVAAVRQSLLAVDLNTRRAVAVPEFVGVALASA